MKLHSNCLSGPKIQTFLKVFPFLCKEFKEETFIAPDAAKKINSHPELGVWCYTTKTLSKREKERQEAAGKTSLDLQNALHCFAGRLQSSVIDKETGQKFQLLDWIDDLTYKIRPGALAKYTKLSEGSEASNKETHP